MVSSVVGAVFSENRQEVLMILRADVPVWVLPGGKKEARESPEEAIAREIAEETGLIVEVKRLVGIYTPQNALAKKTHLYECHVVGGETRNSLESLSVCFFPLHSLPSKIPPPFRSWIEESLDEHSQPIERVLYEVSYAQFFRYALTHPVLVLRFLLAKMGCPINSKKEKGKDKREKGK